MSEKKNPTGLEFFTSEELIDELSRRKTFQGVIIHSRDEFKENSWPADVKKQFHIRWINLPLRQVANVLGIATNKVASRT